MIIPTTVARQPKQLFACLFFLCSLLFFVVPISSGQTSQLVPLVTDQTPMGLSPDFGLPATRVVNQNGDFAFVGEGNSAIFFLSHTAASGSRPSLILQYGNAFPGFAGSRITSLANVQLNNNGVLAFQAGGNLATGQSFSVILSYNGTSFQDLVDNSMTAPGLGGPTYGNLTLLGLDDSGDFAFLSNAGGQGLDLYIAMAGSSPALVAAVGQTAPGTGGTFSGFINGNHTNSLIPPSFNNLGQLLMGVNIAGGRGDGPVCIFHRRNPQGSCQWGHEPPRGPVHNRPIFGLGGVQQRGSGCFHRWQSRRGSGRQFSLDQLTHFRHRRHDGAGCRGGQRATRKPRWGAGTMSFVQASATSINVGRLGLDDNGDIVAIATLSGNSATGQALLRFVANPANSTTYSTQVAAYANEAAPGVTGEVFSFIQNASINNSGLVAFDSQLANTGKSGPGTIVGGIFEQPASGAVSAVVLNGQAVTGLAGGGNFLLFFEDQSHTLFEQVPETVTLNNGTVFFACDVAGGAADHGEFSWSGGVLRILMNTGQALQAGANVAMSVPSGAGDYVAYVARYAGGQANLVVHNIVTQATQTVAYEGEPATGTPATIKTIGPFYVNSLGHVAFGVSLTGGGTGDGGVFVAIPGSGITKIAAAGDIDPATGATIFAPGLPLSTSGVASPFNNSDQVAFIADVTAFDEIFVGAPGITPVKVAAQGDAGLGGLPLFGETNISLNNLGQLAFLNVQPGTLNVTSTGSTLVPEEIFVAVPTGSTPAYNLTQIVGTGDSAPGGGTFGILGYPSFNNLGVLAVDAALFGGSAAGGIFVGNASGGGALALDGTAAQAGGNFSLAAPGLLPKINDQNDVTFEAPLSGGASTAGIFVRRGSTITDANPLGVLTAAVLTGQPAPGSPPGGTFASFGTPLLGPTGDIAFPGTYTTGGPSIGGLWHIETNNTIEAIVVQGTVAAEFGGGTLVSSAAGTSWNTGTTSGLGQFPLYGVVSGGSFLDGIFLFEPGINTNTPAGANVTVSPTDATTGTSPVSLTFSDVTAAGTTSLTIASGGPTLPSGFGLGNPPVYYDISTTAVFSGSVTVCINTAGISFPGPQNLRLFHFAGSTWTDITTSVTGTTVCGTTTSLSPFAVVNPVPIVIPASQISTTASGLAYSRVSKTFSGTVTITNITGTSINGPLEAAFTLLPTGVTLVNATGTYNGSPYITVSVSALGAGKSVTIPIQFSDPSTVQITFTPVIYSGSLN